MLLFPKTILNILITVWAPQSNSKYNKQYKFPNIAYVGFKSEIRVILTQLKVVCLFVFKAPWIKMDCVPASGRPGVMV